MVPTLDFCDLFVLELLHVINYESETLSEVANIKHQRVEVYSERECLKDICDTVSFYTECGRGACNTLPGMW